jgi:hypothetical protein
MSRLGQQVEPTSGSTWEGMSRQGQGSAWVSSRVKPNQTKLFGLILSRDARNGCLLNQQP